MLTGQSNRVAGVIMLLLVVVLIVALFTAETPSTEADEFAEDFQKVVDDEVKYLIGQTMQVLTGVFVALLGGGLYVLFRLHDRLLALVGLVGFLLMSVLFVVSSAAYIEVHALAQHLDRGETFAGETEVQEIGRVVVELGDTTFFLGIIFFAIGLLGFGTLIVSTRDAPLATTSEGALTPPTWIGWIAIVAGVLYLIGWLAVVTEWFFIAIIVAFLLTIIWYLVFGVWLLRGSRPVSDTAG